MKRRDFPLIRLAPWEHLPEASPSQIEDRAQSVASLDWRGKRFELAGRMADIGNGFRFVFVRELGSDDEANWVLGEGVYDDWPTPPTNGIKLSKKLGNRGHRPYFPLGRLFCLSAEELQTSVACNAWVGAQGRGCWLPIDGLYDPMTCCFGLPMDSGELFANVTAHEIKQLLLGEVQRQGSDAGFAFDWQRLSQAEREEQILSLERGTIEELRHLLRCTLLVEPIVQKYPGYWDMYLYYPLHLEELQFKFWSETDQLLEGTPDSVRLRLWKRTIMEYFAPSVNIGLTEKHRCVRYWQSNGVLMKVQVQTPTQHERLEAALCLSDWSRDKIDPRKLALLLSRA